MSVVSRHYPTSAFQALRLALKGSPMLLGLIAMLGCGLAWAGPDETKTDGDYEVHIYTTTGGDTFTVPEGVTEVEYLVVGGGGAGGSAADNGVRGTGGGGAGGVQSGTLKVSQDETLDLIVGAGGAGGDSITDIQGADGADSVFATVTASGGGGGGKVNIAGSDGGSAGGGGGRKSTPGGEGNRGEGNDGGQAMGGDTGGEAAGGGGGGAATSGIDGASQNGGDGGTGIASTITGNANWYAGGGGGGGTVSGGAGKNGGGDGKTGNGTNGDDGLANTGGGGGGVQENALGGAGGSGIVVVRFKTISSTSSADVTIDAVPQVDSPDPVQVPVNLSGFGDADEVIAFVSLEDNTGTVKINDTTGLTLAAETGFESPETAQQSLGFRGSFADVEAALADHLEWDAPLEAVETDITVDVVEAATDAVYNPDNGHYYKVMDGGTDTGWQEAKTSAEAQTLFGMTGYLATITSARENDFAGNNTTGTDIWVGASDSDGHINDACGDNNLYGGQAESEGNWYWVTGPEACRQFWAGDGTGSRVVDRFARWEDGEPNNFDGSENFGATNKSGVPGQWNDFGNNSENANDYLVEFGGLDGESSTALRGSAKRTLSASDQIVIERTEADADAQETVPVPLTLPEPVTTTNNELIAGVSVPADDGSDGTLQITSDTSNLTLSEGFAAWTGVTAINFSGPRADVVEALNSIEWTAPNSAKEIELTMSVAENDSGAFFNSVNGHFYKVVDNGSAITWKTARDQAEGETLFGMQGYLATLTSEQENDFAANNTTGDNIWIGASDEREAINNGCSESRHSAQEAGDSPSEGEWYWVTGPEACNQFWSGAGSEDGGEPVDGEFESWDGTIEPNNSGGTEHFAATNWSGGSGKWNDLDNDTANNTDEAQSYLVEFGGRADEASTALQAGGTGTLAAAVAPDAPTGVVATADDNNAEVSWEAPASDGFSDITEYTVTSEPDGVTCTAQPPQTNCTVDGLKNGTEYSFTVTATNGQGTSAASDVSEPVTPGVSYDGGDGSGGSPYQVSTAGQMVQLADDPSAHYVLSEDIDLSGKDWPPIGTTNDPFTGSLSSDDGTPRAISGLAGKPVFGEIGAGAAVADLTVKGSQNADAGDNAGLLADAIRGADGDRATIDNVLVDTDSSISGNDNIGALAGTTEYAEFTGVTVDGSASGNNQVGGVSGTVSDSTLTDTTVNGDVAGNNNVGSVGGTIDDSDLTNTKTTGGVQGSGSNVGSVGGQINRSDNANCVLDTIQSDGNVSGGNKTGGVGGSIDGCSVDNAEVTGDVQGEDQTGGIGGDIKNADIGTAADSTIVVDGNVEGRDGVGGVGGTVGDSAIENATVNGDVVGDSNVGAIVGSGENVTQTNTSSSGGISCQADMAGLGTEDDACQVTSWTQLASVSEGLDRHYELMNDLGPDDADYDQYASATANGDEGWVPLGDSFDNYFSGSFDGQDHTITGLTIARPAQSQVGLFGRTGDDAAIRNLGLKQADILGEKRVGVLIGRAVPAEVINSSGEGSVEGSGNNVGGLIGHLEEAGASITESHASVSVSSSGNAYAGGLVGLAEGASISDSYATGQVTLEGNQAGGLVGEARGVTITGSYAEGDVLVTSAAGFSNGGLVGLQEGGLISQSYATGDVSGISDSGGALVGYVWGGGVIEDSFANGDVSGTDSIGGMIGWLDDGEVHNAYATGAVSGDTNVGGLVGLASDPSIIADSFVANTVTGNSDVGGVVGFSDNAQINGAYYDRTVNADMADESRGRTTEELNDFATFDGNWNIEDDPNITRDYPALTWENDTDYGDATWFIGTAVFERGRGTSDDPFVVSDEENLSSIADYPDSHFELDGGSDGRLDVGADWQPIGSESDPFTGSVTSLDGEAVSLDGLNGEPLFDTIGPGAEVGDIDIVGSVNEDAGSDSGLLANQVQGDTDNPAVLRDISIDGDSVISGDDRVGAVAGTIDNASLSGVNVDADVDGNNDVGGVAGRISDSTVSGVEVNGDVSGNDRVGGIGGDVTDTDISNGAVNGSVTGDGDNVDDVAGRVDDSSTVEDVSSGDDDASDGPLVGEVLDGDGEPLGDGPIGTGEEVRIPLEGVTRPLDISGTVTRGNDEQALEDGVESGEVLTDPDSGDALLTRDDDDYFFSANRGGVYRIRFEDGDAETFDVEFEVRPQVAFSSTRQLGTSGMEVIVRPILEGEPAQFPVRVPYEVTNHDLLERSDLDAEGSFTFEADQEEARIRRFALTPGVDTGDITVTLKQGDSAEAALLGDPETHRIVLRQRSEVPLFAGIDARQADSDIATLVHEDDGSVTLTAVDAGGNAFSDDDNDFDWSRSDLELGVQNEDSASVDFDPANLADKETVRARVAVTEDGSDGRRATAQMRLRIVGDGDSERLAQFSDFLAESEDADSRVVICPRGEGQFRAEDDRACSQVDRTERSVFMQTSLGHRLRLGRSSESASWDTGDFGLEAEDGEILDESGDPASNTDDAEFDHLGYGVDFEISDLEFPGQSVPTVVPLPEGEAIPEEAVWRKFSDGSWDTFTEDDANELFSAPRESGGGCPWPGSDRWDPGLNEGDGCVRLVIEDGGPNDFDGEADGVIRDPSTLAVQSTEEKVLRSRGGGGSVGIWVLLGLLLLVLLAHRHRLPLPVRRFGLLALLALVSSSAAAEKDHPWYLGGQLGWAMTDVDSGDINRRLSKRNLSGDATVSDEDRLGLRAHIGYQWRPWLSFEGGYTNLGEITTEIDNAPASVTPEQLRGVRPGTGDGLEASALGRYEFHPDWEAIGRVGLMYWHTEQAIAGRSDTNTGVDPVVGVGVEHRFHDAWSARVSVDRYRVENDDTLWVGIGVNYHFGGGGSAPAASQPKAERAPAPEAQSGEAENAEQAGAEREVAQVVELNRPEDPSDTPEVVAINRAEPEEAESEPEPQADSWVVRFDLDGTRTAKETDILMAIRQRMEEKSEAQLLITGHTDNQGSEAYNERLSMERAERLERLLVGNGVDADRIETQGMGESEPVADNDTEAGRELNRRVEIKLE